MSGFDMTRTAADERDEAEAALRQALDRMEAVWNLMHPGDLTADELHGMSQNLWFGMEEIKAALGEPSFYGDAAERIEASIRRVG